MKRVINGAEQAMRILAATFKFRYRSTVESDDAAMIKVSGDTTVSRIAKPPEVQLSGFMRLAAGNKKSSTKSSSQGVCGGN